MAVQLFINLIQNKTRLRLFLLKKLPAAYFSGVRLKEVSAESCTASVPYNWFTKNPFRSTYFASLSMAAELTTGVLGMANIYKEKPAVSMLLVSMEGKFYKKAVSKTYFTCNDGLLLQQAVAKAVATGTGQAVQAYAKGVNDKNETIAEFWFTWSFKVRSV